MKLLPVLLLLISGGAAAATNECANAGNMGFVCGPQAAEDLVRIGTTRWLVGSGMGGAGQPGRLHLIDTKARSWEVFQPSSPMHDKRRFPQCDGAPDATKFSAHGLALRALGAGRHELLVVNHGGREAVEFYELHEGAARPMLHWLGCVPLPHDTNVNSVAQLADGGFLATLFYVPSLGGIDSVFASKVNGAVLEWHPGGEVTRIAGTELSGANGIVASTDGKVFHVAEWGRRNLVRFDRQSGQLQKRSVALDFAGDNLRWSQDGRSILIGGQKFTPRAGGPATLDGWSVIRVNPDTLAVKKLHDADGTAPMQGISVAVEVDREIWVGPFRGDRVGYFPRTD
jgi:hypothetical protein